MADNSKDNPDAACLPLGHMQLHTHSQPRKIIQTKDLIVIIYEANVERAADFLNGRPAPGNTQPPWWSGVWGAAGGKATRWSWRSTNFRDEGWLDVNGAPLSSSGKLTERFRRPTFGTLEIDVTVDDPKAYTKPWTVRVNQRLLADTELIEFVCNENQQFNPVTGGPMPRR